VTVTAANGDGAVGRLTSVIARQRQELNAVGSRAAARCVVDLARGMLMERLGCGPAEAQRQLAHLAAEAGTTVAELAAEVTSEDPVAAAEQADRRPSLAGAAIEVADDGAGIAAALLDQTLAPAGATAVALWLNDPDGSLQLAGEAGFGPAEASRWRRIHPEMNSLIPRVARDGGELWWPAGRPAGDSTPLMGRWPAGARAVLPLRVAGATLGVMEACWPEPLEDFDAALRRQLTALADVCAQALGARLPNGDLAADHGASWLFGLLDGVVESAMFACALRDVDGRVTDFRIDHISAGFSDPAGRNPAELAGRTLLEAYPAAAIDGGLYDQAAQALASGEPLHISVGVIAALGDAAMAPVLNIRIAPLFDGVVIAWRRADEAERLAVLLQHAERLGRIGGWEENLLTGDVRWTDPTFALFGQQPGDPIRVADLHAHVPADDVPGIERFRDTLLRERRATAAAFRIIRADDGSTRQMRAFAEPVTDPAGTLVALRGAFQDVSAQYHTQVALAATRDRLADSEERAQEEHRLALRLQQAITPRSAKPVEAAGLDVAARYRPAGAGNLVSGDWYDTVMLPTGQVLLAVGDIAGHGIDAVTGMVALRNCLRGLAITGAGPAALLGWLNSVACHLTDGIIGTAICGLYDPVSRNLRWARAGHLPPVLVRDGGAAELPLAQGILLGADPDASYQEITTSLRSGDTLLLFTDGLIERRADPIDDAVRSLLRIAGRPVHDLARYADELMASAASDTDDDACLVAVHIQ
jgi:serine phosphatase RsbU (regulator of sigma subunit)/PAS domain-containing protein